jgi:hypothetical protein
MSEEMTRGASPLEIELEYGFDFIGDIHACYEELLELLQKLGYSPDEEGLYRHPEHRKTVSLGDVMSRGPASIPTMVFFKRHIDAGLAYMTDSNHGWKIARWLDGRKVNLAHGDEKVAEEFNRYEAQYGSEAALRLKRDLREMLMNAPSHLIFTEEGVRTVVACHAGIRDQYIGKDSKRIRNFCRYGDTDGLDENGKPIRKEWHTGHRTGELIVWGHDPRAEREVINNTVNIDQGAVFGGSLTGFRFPEGEFISVKAYKDYSDVPGNPFSRTSI